MQPASAQLVSAARRLERSWWQPHSGPWQWCLAPLAALYGGLMALRACAYRRGWLKQARLPLPVVVVGNYIVGGAGKTPTTITLVRALRQLGWVPGVVSRGYGRVNMGVEMVTGLSRPDAVGDEPLLIHRQTQAPVVVGRDRVEAARALMRAHPRVNLILADDGLQHLRLARDCQVIVFDQRGPGNGWLLPAGPLRERLPSKLPANSWVVYNADAASSRLPGAVASRQLAGAVSLEAWRVGVPFSPDILGDLCQRSQGERALAAAGLAEPERFFRMLEAQGFQIDRLPLPDHAALLIRPWSAATAVVLVTEKDAVKLRPEPALDRKVWVVGLDFTLPDALTQALDARLRTLYPDIAP